MTIRIPNKVARLLVLLVALAALIEPTPVARAGVSVLTSNKFIFNNSGSTVASSGGTYGQTVAIPTDQVMRLRATCIMSSSSGGHLQYGGSLTAEYVVQNSNGTLTAVQAASSSTNPTNSNTTVLTGIVGEFDQADNHTNFNGIDTLVWTVSGTNATVTFTNNSSTTAVYVTIYVETMAAGST